MQLEGRVRKSSEELGHVSILATGNRISGLGLTIRGGVWKKLSKNKAGPNTGRKLVYQGRCQQGGVNETPC